MGERMGMRDYDKSPEEAYECGYEDGYEAAMEETKYGERSSYRMGKRRY
jgi:flagellar biosynthesis/type III secretory pathway protein FliH